MMTNLKLPVLKKKQKINYNFMKLRLHCELKEKNEKTVR